MNYLKTTILILMLLTGTNVLARQHRYALLVGVSKYQKGTDWRQISGTNDVDLLQPVLKEQGFMLTVLRDTSATHGNIIRNLTQLIKKAKKGDVVYLHFSGHGQAVQDISGDETDGWDEAFIPYDAAKSPNQKYKGQHHLLDDELGKYINMLREKLGSQGIVYAVIDACHAGTMDRDEFPPVRGTSDAFTFNEKYNRERAKRATATRYPIASNSRYSRIIMLEACGAEETNQEVTAGRKCYGPLSYSIYEVIREEGLKAQQTWVDNVRRHMESVMKKQKNFHQQRMIEQVAL